MQDNGTMFPEAAETFVETDSGRLFCRVAGRGLGTPLIVIHGGPGFTHDYLLQLSVLGEDRSVIFYDQLDCGRSDRVHSKDLWVVERFASEIDDIRSALRLQEFAVLGHSWGGTIAAEIAVSRPAGLKACILASPLLNTSQWVSDNAIYLAALPEPARTVLAAPSRYAPEEVASATDMFYRHHFFRRGAWPDELSYSYEHLNHALYNYMWGTSEFAATGTLLGYDVTARLPLIECPTLLTCGEFDEAAPATIRRLAATIPDARTEVFANASHNPHIEATDTYADVVREFLASVDNASSTIGQENT